MLRACCWFWGGQVCVGGVLLGDIGCCFLANPLVEVFSTGPILSMCVRRRYPWCLKGSGRHAQTYGPRNLRQGMLLGLLGLPEKPYSQNCHTGQPKNGRVIVYKNKFLVVLFKKPQQMGTLHPNWIWPNDCGCLPRKSAIGIERTSQLQTSQADPSSDQTLSVARSPLRKIRAMPEKKWLSFGQ